MGRHYVSATTVLPEDLLRAVSEALGGRPAHMWVPGRRNLSKTGRDSEALKLYAQGLLVPQIADRLFVSERTVWRILARARAEAEAASDESRGAQGADTREEVAHGLQG